MIRFVCAWLRQDAKEESHSMLSQIHVPRFVSWVYINRSSDNYV
jgi:hypothetical protein